LSRKDVSGKGGKGSAIACFTVTVDDVRSYGFPGLEEETAATSRVSHNHDDLPLVVQDRAPAVALLENGVKIEFEGSGLWIVSPR
jgi:hypothetical protein